MQALQAATWQPARFLGFIDSLGTIEPGRLADLVLLDGDPVDDINNTRLVNLVMVGGRIVSGSGIRTPVRAGKDSHAARR